MRIDANRARIVALLVVLLQICVLTACAAASPDLKGVHTMRLVSGEGQRELILVPRRSVTAIVVFMHGFDSDQDELLVDKGLFPVRDALLAAGYAIATTNAHGNNIGNPISVQDQVNVLRDTRVQFPNVSTVGILAFSMGGVDALLVASAHAFAGLTALALLSPVCDQRAFLTGSYRVAISNAFGDPPKAGLATVVARSNPMLIPATKYEGYAYAFWQSPTDRTVPPSQSAQMLAHLRTAGISAHLTPLDGDHGDLTELQPNDVVKLFAMP